MNEWKKNEIDASKISRICSSLFTYLMIKQTEILLCLPVKCTTIRVDDWHIPQVVSCRRWIEEKKIQSTTQLIKRRCMSKWWKRNEFVEFIQFVRFDLHIFAE